MERDKKPIAATTLSSKEGRMKVYSCVFCEFVQSNLCEEEDETNEDGSLIDGAFEAKYLYHLNTVHGIGK
jgi:hypothetical protein